MTKQKTGDMLYYLQMRMHWVWLSCIGGGENLLSTQGACDIQRICKEWVVENMVKEYDYQKTAVQYAAEKRKLMMGGQFVRQDQEESQNIEVLVKRMQKLVLMKVECGKMCSYFIKHDIVRNRNFSRMKVKDHEAFSTKLQSKKDTPQALQDQTWIYPDLK